MKKVSQSACVCWEKNILNFSCFFLCSFTISLLFAWNRSLRASLSSQRQEKGRNWETSPEPIEDFLCVTLEWEMRRKGKKPAQLKSTSGAQLPSSPALLAPETHPLPKQLVADFLRSVTKRLRCSFHLSPFLSSFHNSSRCSLNEGESGFPD